MKVYVDRTGSPTNIEVTETANSSQVKAAKKAISRVDYDPAILNGKPANFYDWIPLIFEAKRKSEIDWRFSFSTLLEARAWEYSRQ